MTNFEILDNDIKDLFSRLTAITDKMPMSDNEKIEVREIFSIFQQEYNLFKRTILDIDIEDHEYRIKQVNNLALQAWTQGLRIDDDGVSFNDWISKNKEKYPLIYNFTHNP